MANESIEPLPPRYQLLLFLFRRESDEGFVDDGLIFLFLTKNKKHFPLFLFVFSA